VFLSEEVQASQKIVQPAFNHAVFLSKHPLFLHNMQCVINKKSSAVEKVQWSMHAGAFLEKECLLLKENALTRWSFKRKALFLQENYKCGKMKYI